MSGGFNILRRVVTQYGMCNIKQYAASIMRPILQKLNIVLNVEEERLFIYFIIRVDTPSRLEKKFSMIVHARDLIFRMPY